MDINDSADSRCVSDELDKLEQVLEEEFDALRRTDSEALTDCCRRKSAIVDAIASSSSAPGGESNPAAEADLLPTTETGIRERLRELWTKNQRNGLLIAGYRRHTRLALEILTGHDHTEGVYDPRAELPPSELSRSLGRA